MTLLKFILCTQCTSHLICKVSYKSDCSYHTYVNNILIHLHNIHHNCLTNILITQCPTSWWLCRYFRVSQEAYMYIGIIYRHTYFTTFILTPNRASSEKYWVMNDYHNFVVSALLNDFILSLQSVFLLWIILIIEQ